MASQAPQLARQREQNQHQSSQVSESTAKTLAQESDGIATNIHDTETEIEATPHNEEWEAVSEPSALATSTSIEQSTTQQPTQEPTRTCWICQMDDTEDTEEDTEWRAPCPCSLTAHDACLMEWISNEEAPKAGEIAHNHRIKCPQCKAEIQIERPRRLFITMIELIQTLVKLAVAPAAVGAILSCTYWGLMAYGVHTLNMVFGSQEAARILTEPILKVFNNGSEPFYSKARLLSGISLCLGVPLIGPSLILLRTKLADQAFSLLLPLYFLYPSNRTISWPPSPALAFATIPYLRSAYNEIYRLKLSGLEKQWDLAVQRRPRPGETAEQIAAEANRIDDEDDEVLEININFGDLGADELPQQQAEIGPQVPLAQPDGGNILPQEQIGVDAAPAPADIPNQPRPNADRRWEVQQNTSLSSLTNMVMGALFFPVISSVAGDILKHTLPTRFIQPLFIVSGGIFTRSRLIVNKGLLSEKWGRTLVGGCLFVVLKDVVTLYCKWRKAKDFGQRKVKDWIGRRGGDRRAGTPVEPRSST